MATDHDRLLLLLHVARRYYLDDAGQQDIANECGVSRATVSRLLSQARERGVVRIEVGHPLERVVDLEAELVTAFGLRAARVAQSDVAVEGMESVAGCAAEVVVDLVHDDAVIAVSNGTALSAMVAAMPQRRKRDVTVVQMIGSLGQDNQLIDSPDLCRRLADSLGGTYRIMPVPLVVKTASLATAMRRENSIAMTLALGSRPDVALVGIGACDEQGSGHIFDGWMTPAINRRLRDAGAVGHVVGHHFDRSGRHIDSELCHRTIGVAIERLREIPTVVGVAAGANKEAAILGALRGGMVDILVTDPATATAVLGRHQAG